MNGVFFAETAILVHFQPVRIILLVFHRVVVALLALAASQSDFYPHVSAPPVSSDCFASLKKENADGSLPLLENSVSACFLREGGPVSQVRFCTKK